VPDQKPPQSLRDERTTLLALLRYQRESSVRKVVDVDDADARRAYVGSGTLAAAIETYRDGWTRVEAILDATPSLDTPCARADEAQANLRWVLMHLLEETARHAGHADIIRELIDGQTGR
jgi:uncharacterized protein DUF664